MTGMVATQAEEFWDVYKLAVAVIRRPPVIRQDLLNVVSVDSETESSAAEEIQKFTKLVARFWFGTAAERLENWSDRRIKSVSSIRS